MLPLRREQAREFLLSRPIGADTDSRLHGPDYTAAVDAFLRQNLDAAPTEEDHTAAAQVLANHFDLSLAADLLAQGLSPSATRLIDEAFRMADEGTQGVSGCRDVVGQPFPLVNFGCHAVAMRLEDRNWLKADEFAAEVPFLMDRKLLVPRTVRSPTGDEQRIQFRHDRVWDFFIAAAFNADPALWEIHLTDPRFRGAYLRIAETWPADAATKVRDDLIVSAARRGDHTTSDEFIKRLEARKKVRRRSRETQLTIAPTLLRKS